MKSLAKALSGITIVVLVFLVYLLYGSRLHIRLAEVSTQPASDRAEAFSNIKAAAQQGDAGILLFTGEALGNAADYDFVTLTYEVTNAGLLPAEWLQIEITPAADDVLQLAGDISDIPGLRKVLISTVLLTPRGAQSANRDAYFLYYVAGRPLSAAAQ